MGTSAYRPGHHELGQSAAAVVVKTPRIMRNLQTLVIMSECEVQGGMYITLNQPLRLVNLYLHTTKSKEYSTSSNT